MAKEFLARHGVPFVSHDIRLPDVRDELVGRGFMTVPVAFVGGVGYPGFDPDALRRALALDEPAGAAGPAAEAVREELPAVLGAWTRAVRQLPPQRAEAVESRHDVYTVLQHVVATMAAASSGVWDFAAAHSGGERVRPSDGALLEWVEGVEVEAGAWLPTLTQEQLDRVCSGHYGVVTVARLIEISCARAAFQLRHFYARLRELGVEPSETLADELLERIGSPRATSDRA